MDTSRVNRFEIIDFRPCITCNGKGIVVAENYTMSGEICKRCNGTGSMGRKVIVGGPVYHQPDSTKIELSLQDDGRTLKVFLQEKTDEQ